MKCKIIFFFFNPFNNNKKTFGKIICKGKGKKLQRQTAKIIEFSEKNLNVGSWM